MSTRKPSRRKWTGWAGLDVNGELCWFDAASFADTRGRVMMPCIYETRKDQENDHSSHYERLVKVTIELRGTR